MGGAEIAAQRFPAGLVDERQLFLGPIILGGGSRLCRAKSAHGSNCWTNSGSAMAWVHIHYRVTTCRPRSSRRAGPCRPVARLSDTDGLLTSGATAPTGRDRPESVALPPREAWAASAR